ncbi:MAG: PKD domain-containing protein, partial [Thermoplasmata archaeon]|nr:PKD domain-containing protein [Thermoplasmata archaeon]
MSISLETDHARRTRRTQFWTLLTLVIAVGGLSLVTSGSAPSFGATPFSGSAHLAPHLLWTPLTISAFAAAPNPAFINNATTIAATVIGGQSPYTYTYTGLPAGCSSSNAPSITCTSSARGNSTVVLKVNDTGGNVTKNAFILTVNAFTISSFLVSPAIDSLGSPITFSADYGGASGVVTWGWTGLPAGCVAPTGKAFTCTPTVAGTFTVKLTGTDASAVANAKSVTVQVTPVSISTFSVSPSSEYTGQTTTFTTVITGTTGAVTYSYTGLPIGCTSQNLASLPCIARVAGTYTVTVTARDSAGDTSVKSTTLTVKPLTITSWVATPASAYELTTTTYTVTAFGWLGVVVGGVGTAGYPIYSYTGLPAGCPAANKTQIICKPTVQGTFVVNVTVSDPTGNHTSKSLTMVVNPAAQPELYVPVSTSFSDPAVGSRTCVNTNNAPFYSSTCYLQAQDPTVLALGGAITGIGYAVYTNATNNTCPGA